MILSTIRVYTLCSYILIYLNGKLLSILIRLSEIIYRSESSCIVKSFIKKRISNIVVLYICRYIRNIYLYIFPSPTALTTLYYIIYGKTFQVYIIITFIFTKYVENIGLYTR